MYYTCTTHVLHCTTHVDTTQVDVHPGVDDLCFVATLQPLSVAVGAMLVLDRPTCRVVKGPVHPRTAVLPAVVDAHVRVTKLPQRRAQVRIPLGHWTVLINPFGGALQEDV